MPGRATTAETRGRPAVRPTGRRPGGNF